MRSAILLISVGILMAQRPEPRRATFEEQPALVLANGTIELTVFPKGGAFANLVLADDPEKLSPLWNPSRLAREAGKKDIFGTAFGHFVCVDGFGPVSPEEQAAGLPGHGEAHEQPFDIKYFGKEGPTTTLTLAARLPITQENFTRTLRVVDGENVVYVENQLESLLGFDRPVFWAEHATIGSPFLEPGVTVVDMPVHRAKTRPYQPGPTDLPHRLPSDKEFTWPNAPTVSGRKVDLRAAPVPPNSGDHTTSLLDPARKLVFITALHPGKRLVLGYIFKPQEFPWVQNWEYYPPNGKMARGMEISSQPFDAPRREVVQLNSLFGSPVYRWLPAKSKIEARFLFFYAHTPEGFRKVDDVRMEGGQIVVEDHKARLKVTLAASLPL
jgi:hypothetical protein